MKSRMLAAIALLALPALAVPAPAQEAEVIVTVPFEFVVGTRTLPAGKYTVNRTESLAASPLLIYSHDGGAFLLPATFDDTQAGKTSVAFDVAGAEHVLSQIKTPSGTYTIDNRREVARLTKVAQSNGQTSGMTSSGGQ